jgi:hypothetical protein
VLTPQPLQNRAYAAILRQIRCIIMAVGCDAAFWNGGRDCAAAALAMCYAIFYSGHYAIHATAAVAQLGSRASKGCVRLNPSNAAVLFELVQQHGPANTRILVQD